MTIIRSFDSTTSTESEIINLSRLHISNRKYSINDKIIPRGAGLSQRLMSAANGCESIVLSDNLDSKDYIFDTKELLVKVDANATFSNLNAAAFQVGLELPVIPGLPFVQIGSGIAACVHGKNHYLYDFGDWVQSFELLLYTNEIIECSRTNNKEIFELTLGGYGSTGLILSAVIKLKKRYSTTVRRERNNIVSLNDTLHYYTDPNLNSYHGVFGWHNLHGKSSRFGEGFIYQDSYIEGGELYCPPPVKAEENNADPNLPSRLFVPGKFFFGSIFNTLYSVKEKRAPKTSRFNSFSGTPLSSKNIYWSIMRANGFIENQFLIPYNRFEEFSKYLKATINKTNATTAVCITKPANGKRGYLRYRGAGVSIDLTGVANSTNIKFFTELNNTAKSFDALPNIIKCSLLDLDTIKKCYGEQYDIFMEDYIKTMGKEPPSWFLKNGLLDKK